MKKLLAVTMGMGCCLFLATTANALILGSAHDFSTAGPAGTGAFSSDTCLPCHTPHNRDPNTKSADAPLWNHELSTVAAYTLYTGTGATLDATDMGNPSGVSKLCLSCHDGTVAPDAFGGSAGGSVTMAGSTDLGTDLSDDHPVSFTYNTALATTDGELVDPSQAGSSGLGGTIAADMLFVNKMECASCHDVHNTANVAKLLVKTNANSALCLTCHIK